MVRAHPRPHINIFIIIKHKRQKKKKKKERPFSNKKGLQLIVTRIGNTFYKYKKQLQRMNNKTIVHYVEA